MGIKFKNLRYFDMKYAESADSVLTFRIFLRAMEFDNALNGRNS